MSETTQKPRGERKVREGMVVSDRMDKTIVVTLRSEERRVGKEC